MQAHMVTENRLSNVRRDQPIPEPALWYFFLCMAQGCDAMAVRPDRRYASGDEVIHQDIKTDNIFLDTPDPNNYPHLPVAKFGDFGAAR